MTRWLHIALVLALAIPAPLPAASPAAAERDNCAMHSGVGDAGHAGHSMPMRQAAQSDAVPIPVSHTDCDHCGDGCDGQDCASQCISAASVAAIIIRALKSDQWMSTQPALSSLANTFPQGHPRLLLRPPIYS